MEKLKNLFFGKYFFILSPLSIIFIIHVFSQPYYLELSERSIPCDRCCNLQKKIERKDHLFESVSKIYDPSTHMSKTEFRLAVPLLLKILGIQSKVLVYILQVIIGLVFFILLTYLIYKHTQDQLITFLFTLGFAFIYTGYSFVAESEGYLDSFAFFFLLIAFLDINWGLIALVFFLAFWTDERALLSGLLIVFWGQYRNQIQKKDLNKISKVGYAYLLSLLMYVSLRIYLIKAFGFKNQIGDVGINILKHTLDYAGLYIWQIFEGFWILICLGFYYLWKNSERIYFLIFAILTGFIVIANLFVLDLTRAGAYLFPSIIISFMIVFNHLKNKELMKKLLLGIILIVILYPRFTMIAPERLEPKKPIYRIYYPIYMKILKKLL